MIDIRLICCCLIGVVGARAADDYQVGAYYFPNYHVDARNEKDHGPGWMEWELVKAATPRFPGHDQPKVPLWGYTDEADPKQMAQKIDAAADHGIDYFIFDWYYYDDGPFLQRGLDEGYLRAANNGRVKFCLMWANHDWHDIHPAKRSMIRDHVHHTLYPGAVKRETFDKICDLVIERYFKHPSHFKVNGAPYFSVYDIGAFIRSMGGLDGAAKAFADFRAKTKAAGFPDLHLNGVFWGRVILPGETAVQNPKEVAAKLGFDTATSYVWIHHVAMKDFPETEYGTVMEGAIKYWNEAEAKIGIPYYPNVSMGWDASPRTVQTDRFLNIGYPYTPVLKNNTPENFKKALVEVKKFLDTRGRDKILNINSWNEWTEGSYLEPDAKRGMGYLEAVRDVFGANP